MVHPILSKDYKRRFLKASFNQLSKNFDNELSTPMFTGNRLRRCRENNKDENRLAILQRINKEIYGQRVSYYIFILMKIILKIKKILI